MILLSSERSKAEAVADVRASDTLRADLVNSIPHPIMARFLCGDIWPVIDIAVDVGWLRIDVCGLSQVMQFSEVTHLIGGDGISREADEFYNEDGGGE